MLSVRKIFWATLGLLLLAFVPQRTSHANPADPGIPPGFRLILSARGVQLYRKDYPGGNPDYVQRIDLSRGASIELLHGDIAEERKDKGVYGGDDPRFLSKSLQQYWREFSTAHPNAFCVTNGQFFYMREYPTRLPFPLKKDNEIVTDGYGIKQFPDQKLILEIWPDHVNIQKLTKRALYGSSAPNIVAGLAEDASKSPSKFVPRTFIGIDDRDRDGRYETVLIFNTMTARQSDAGDVLRSFGAEKVMMLDGGGSTQLTCEGKDYISSDRLIPQAIGVLGEALPPLSATLATSPGWPIVSTGEDIQVDIVMTNTGTLTWTPEEVYLVVDEKPWGKGERLALDHETKPGSTATFTWTPKSFTRLGVYSARWYLVSGKEKFPGDPERINIIVLPAHLVNERSDLQVKVVEWEQMRVINIDPLVKDWLDGQLVKGAPKNRLALVKSPEVEPESGGAVAAWIAVPAVALLVTSLLLFNHGMQRAKSRRISRLELRRTQRRAKKQNGS